MKNKTLPNQDLTEPQTFYPSKRKWIFIGSALTFMAVIPFCILVFGDVKPNEKWGIIIGLTLVVALGIMCFLIASPKATYFKISKTGFENSFLFIKKSFLWKDITGFGIHIILNGKPIIGFNTREGYQDNSMFMKTSTGKAFQKMFDYKYQIQDNYGYDSYELLSHLNFLLEKYKTQ
jgi:hypothetical protein